MKNKYALILIGLLAVGCFFIGKYVAQRNAEPKACPQALVEAKNSETASEEACKCPSCDGNPCENDPMVLEFKASIEGVMAPEGSPSSVRNNVIDNAEKVDTDGMYSTEAVYRGLTSDNIHLQNTGCHYANDYPDDRLVEPLIKILTNPDIINPLPSNHEWAENYLGFGCMDALVSQWYLHGNSEKAWQATLNYFKTVSLANFPQEQMDFGMFSRLTDDVSKANDDWAEKATYYKPELLAEALFTFIRNGAKYVETHSFDDIGVERYDFVDNAAVAMLVHEPEYVKYLILEPSLPMEVRIDLVPSLYSFLADHSNKPENVTKNACEFFTRMKEGKKLNDPNLKKLGLPDQVAPSDYHDFFEAVSGENALDCNLVGDTNNVRRILI